MAYSESYTCDVCGKQKAAHESWWLVWLDCFQADKVEDDQPLIKFTRWNPQLAHSAGVRHLCGAQCAGKMMDRWMSEQHENPDAHCEPTAVHPMPEQVQEITRKAVGFSAGGSRGPLPIEITAAQMKKDE